MIGPTSWWIIVQLLVVNRFHADTDYMDHFSTSFSCTEYGILGDLLTFLIQQTMAYHQTRQND